MAQKYRRKPLLKISYIKSSLSWTEHFRRLSDLTALQEANVPDEVKARISDVLRRDIEANKPKMHPLAFLDACGGAKRLTTDSERTDFDDLTWKADVFTCGNLIWAGIEWPEIQEKLPGTTASNFDVWHMCIMCDFDRFWSGQGKRKHTRADCLSDWNNLDPKVWDSSPFNIDARKLADMLRKSKGW